MCLNDGYFLNSLTPAIAHLPNSVLKCLFPKCLYLLYCFHNLCEIVSVRYFVLNILNILHEQLYSCKANNHLDNLLCVSLQVFKKANTWWSLLITTKLHNRYVLNFIVAHIAQMLLFCCDVILFSHQQSLTSKCNCPALYMLPFLVQFCPKTTLIVSVCK